MRTYVLLITNHTSLSVRTEIKKPRPSDKQAAITTPLDYLLHLFGFFFSFFLCPQFSFLSSFYLLSSPKAETVAKQPAQHNSAALQLGSPLSVPLWFQTIKYTRVRIHTECVWGKVKAMNSFHLISESQKSL